MWIEDPSTESGWRWDTEATSVLNAPAAGPVSGEVVPSAPHVLDLSIGDGGGGRAGGGILPAIDPDAPVEHVDALAPALATAPAGEAGAEPSAAWGVLVGCPACGSGVTPDRLRE